jgi:hypothetical protein
MTASRWQLGLPRSTKIPIPKFYLLPIWESFDNLYKNHVDFSRFQRIRAVNMTVCWQVGITCCFSLVILYFPIWQFTLTRQIDKFKLLSIISNKSKKIFSQIRISRMTWFTLCWRLSSWCYFLFDTFFYYALVILWILVMNLCLSYSCGIKISGTIVNVMI